MHFMIWLGYGAVMFGLGAAVRDWQTRRDWRKWQRELAANDHKLPHYRRSL